jgi:Alkaline phosphatase PhoX
MRFGKRAAALGAVATAAVAGAAAIHAGASDIAFTNIPTANEKAPGFAPPNRLSPELQEVIWAQGSNKIENPDGPIAFYGYQADGKPMVPALGSNVEAQKTEPDKNTYLVFRFGLKGADPQYDYGDHFLFQGHEAGSPGYVTRINLDADSDHRVTLLADKTSAGAPMKTIDGSTWDPFAKRLLVTNEGGATGAVYQLTTEPGGPVDDISGQLGRAGWEGIQNDGRGNLYLAADTGGVNGTGANAFAKQPNSFIYRFLPAKPSGLTQGGKIQALQVIVNGTPLTFTSPVIPSNATPAEAAALRAAAADVDISGANSAGYVALHQNGTSYPTRWVTIATTTAATPLPGPDANALAKAAGATPFKRPENGMFRPGTGFRQFFFDETGDTDLRTSATTTGGFGSLFRLDQNPTSDTGRISVFYNGDAAHAAFDNLTFFSEDDLGVVEDAGDTLHTQRNALDSAFMFDVEKGGQPVRFIAEARDASATIDSGLSGTQGFQNEGDNEITGIHVSDGDPSANGILGAKKPRPFAANSGWRAFWTQQHGDNVTWELIASPRG